MITSRRLRIRAQASGTTQTLRVYSVKGRNPRAPKAYIQSSMHGSEVQGNAVIAALLDHFARERPLGDITLVPNANPGAIDQKAAEYTPGRFDPTTGANWNRNYWLPEIREAARPAWAELKQRAWATMARQIRAQLRANIPYGRRLGLTLQSLAVGADFVLDLHNANVSVRHIYAPSFAVASARYARIPLLLSIPNLFDGALDESVSCAWWSFRDRLEAEGYADLPAWEVLPRGYTFELGGHEVISRADGLADAAGILDLLQHHGIVAGRPRRPPPGFVCLLDNYKTIYSQHAGHADYIAPLGRVTRKGAPLVQTLQFGDTARWEPTLAGERCIPILRHSSAIIHEGSELMKVFTRFRRA